MQTHQIIKELVNELQPLDMGCWDDVLDNNSSIVKQFKKINKMTKKRSRFNEDDIEQFQEWVYETVCNVAAGSDEYSHDIQTESLLLIRLFIYNVSEILDNISDDDRKLYDSLDQTYKDEAKDAFELYHK